MRKIIFILIAAMLLVGCGSNSGEELNIFIESFNNNEDRIMSATIDKIQEEEVGEIENGMQLLNENKYRYKIFAKYDGDDLVGYQLEIDPEDWYNMDSMAGYDVAEIIVSTLELDKKQFETEYSKAVIGGGEHKYSDNEYDIEFYYYLTTEGEFNGATIDFNKN